MKLALADALLHVGSEATLPLRQYRLFSGLRVGESDRKKYDTVLSDSHAHLGSALVGRDLMEEAIAHHREASRIRADLSRAFPGDYAVRRYVLISTTDLANDLERT